MSYYFSFDQYPTKEIEELCREFAQKTLVTRIDRELERLEEEKRTLDALPTYENQPESIVHGKIDSFQPLSDSFNNQEKYKTYAGNGLRQQHVKERIQKWQSLREVASASESSLSQITDEKKLEETTLSLLEAMHALVKGECDGYSESSSDMDFRFLSQLFERVEGVNINDEIVYVTTEQWRHFFAGLSKQLILEELEKNFEEEQVKEEDRVEMKDLYFALLVKVKELVTSCLARGWDLRFSNEIWGMNASAEEFAALKEKELGGLFRILTRREPMSH